MNSFQNRQLAHTYATGSPGLPQPETGTPQASGSLTQLQRLTFPTTERVTKICMLQEQSGADPHRELLHAVVDAPLVLVDVGPGVARGTKRGDIARRGLGDPASSIQTHEHPAAFHTMVSSSFQQRSTRTRRRTGRGALGKALPRHVSAN
jgi:hypothetical protein